MLRFPLLHPEILEGLGRAGHGSRVLLADGNYPVVTGTHPETRRVFLNLASGILDVPTVLAAVAKAIPIEAAHVMVPDSGAEPPIFAAFRGILGPTLPLQPLERFAFYDAARERDTVLVIATAEQRVYANILLTVGVVQPA